MIMIRDEEAHIGWACSAQNSELLPDRLKKKKAGSAAKTIKGMFADG